MSDTVGYMVRLHYATYGIEVDLDTKIVVEAPPIAKWMTGKDFPTIQKWVEKKKGTIEFLD